MFLQQRHAALRDGRAPFIPIVLPGPEGHTPLEKEQHLAMGHLPYAGWCELCVRGNADSAPRRQRTLADKMIGPVALELYFMFMSNELDVVDGLD